MRKRTIALALAPVIGAAVYLPTTAEAGPAPRPFKAADLKIEVNATDGDAGLQVFLDDDAWKEIAIASPSGKTLLDVDAEGRLRDYGLTELFSESSEPPFDEFPLAEFKKLFPEGDYVFTGRLVDGTRLRSVVPLTHDIPDGPDIQQPKEDAELARNGVVVRWSPPAPAPGIDIVGYQVLVVREDGTKTLSADLPATARRLPVPAEFFQPKTEYKVEVLAIESSGNQTLTEVPFTTR